jgi:hypothetical protein
VTAVEARFEHAYDGTADLEGCAPPSEPLQEILGNTRKGALAHGSALPACYADRVARTVPKTVTAGEKFMLIAEVRLASGKPVR